MQVNDEAMTIAKAKRDWEEKKAQNSKERQESFYTSSTEVRSLYTPADTDPGDYIRDTGFPGEYPYTRGIQSTMYRGRLWTMRQYAGYGTPEETNEKFKFLLAEGQTGLSAAFDLPTQIGYDSDDPASAGEVGKVGVAINSLKDMEIVFDGIPLDQVSTSMTINATAPILMAMYVAVGEKQGVDPAKLTGTTQNDILKEYVARGTYIFPPKPSVRLAANLIAYCAREVPRWNAISVSGYHMRDAGSTAPQEMAFAIANAQEYVKAVLAQGLMIDQFAPRISWIFNTHNRFFEEIAKYRALRRLWAKVMRERFGAQDPRSWMLRTHSQTGGSTLTAQQPLNNIVRAAYQGLAAVLGGVQSLALSCYDEALALPTEEAQRTALRAQQIIAYETGAADTIDPLAGSYFVEQLTNELERKAEEYLVKLEDMGGAIAAVENGYMQREIAEAAYLAQQDIETGRQIIIGVNGFVTDEESSPGIFRVDPRAVEIQKNRLTELRRERDDNLVVDALSLLRAAAEDDHADLMGPILGAVRSYATIGEICGVLREVFGSYEPVVAI